MMYEILKKLVNDADFQILFQREPIIDNKYTFEWSISLKYG